MTIYYQNRQPLHKTLRKSAQSDEVVSSPEEEEAQAALDALQGTVKELDARASQLETQSVSLGATLSDLNERLGTLSKSLTKAPTDEPLPGQTPSPGGVTFPGFSSGLDRDPELEKLYQGGEGVTPPEGGLTAGPPTMESLQKDLQYVTSRLGFFEKQFEIRSREMSILQSQVEEAETFLGIGDAPSIPESEETPPWISGETPDTSTDVMQQFENDRMKEEFDAWYDEMQSPPTPPEPSPKKPTVSPQERKEWDEFLKSLEPEKGLEPVKDSPKPPEPKQVKKEVATPPAKKPTPQESPKYNPIYDEGTVIPPKPEVKPPTAPNAPVPPAAQPKAPSKAPKTKAEPKKEGPAWGEEKEEDWTPKAPPKKKDDDWDEEYAPEVSKTPSRKTRKTREPKEKLQDSHFYDDNPSIEDINEVLQQMDQRSKSKR